MDSKIRIKLLLLICPRLKNTSIINDILFFR